MERQFEQELKYLKNEALNIGITIDDEMIKKFNIFTGVLLEWNEFMNLTAIKEPKEIMIRHFLDSMAPLPYNLIPQDATLIDVGCGAGFPGLPLKFARDDIKLTLLDSLQKRLNFLNSFLEKSNIKNVKVVNGRAEEMSSNISYRDKYDIAVSRAVAELRVLCEYCMPYVKTGGLFIAYKGKNTQEELNDAKNAIKVLGGVLEDKIDIKLPNEDIVHSIIVIRKKQDTLPQYPRRQAKIVKDPL